MGENCEQRYDPCLESPCAHGVCSQLREERSEEADFSCECEAGYSGPLCEVNIDDCQGVTDCGPGQHCVDLLNSYKCCPIGFRGAQCDENINECESSPCLHGGRCVEGVGDYQCVCQDGWTGQDCQLDIDECAENEVPLGRNGTCVPMCRTTGGTAQGDLCKFPFEYGGGRKSFFCFQKDYCRYDVQ